MPEIYVKSKVHLYHSPAVTFIALDAHPPQSPLVSIAADISLPDEVKVSKG